MASTNPLTAIMERLREKLKTNPKKAKPNAQPARTLAPRAKKSKRNPH